jgi:hypothetical protein
MTETSACLVPVVPLLLSVRERYFVSPKVQIILTGRRLVLHVSGRQLSSNAGQWVPLRAPAQVQVETC